MCLRFLWFTALLFAHIFSPLFLPFYIGQRNEGKYLLLMRYKFFTCLSYQNFLAIVKLMLSKSSVTHIRLVQTLWLPSVLISPITVSSLICVSSRHPLWRWVDIETPSPWDFFSTTSLIIMIYSPNDISLFYLRYFRYLLSYLAIWESRRNLLARLSILQF